MYKCDHKCLRHAEVIHLSTCTHSITTSQGQDLDLNLDLDFPCARCRAHKCTRNRSSNACSYMAPFPRLLFSARVISRKREPYSTWELRGILRISKINLKYKLQSRLNKLYLTYKGRNQAVMSDAHYLLQIRIYRKEN